MRLRLEFPDKYRLWSELVRANTDRVFIEALELPRLGQRLPIELSVGGVLIHALAEVVGVRTGGGRFKAGAWVRFDDAEVAKVRRFIGLTNEGGRPETGRIARREPCTLKLTLTNPSLEHAAQVRNLSETGALVETTAQLKSGQFIEADLTLDDNTVTHLRAEVTREGPVTNYVGLRFLELDAPTTSALRLQLERLVQRPARQRQTIIVADDELSILEFLSRALSKFGFVIIKARSGLEAMTLIRELKPELVLLDILMPGMDGVDICKSMRADVELAATPVIFASALDAGRLHMVADEAGATDYLSKPLLLGDLLNTVGKYLKS